MEKASYKAILKQHRFWLLCLGQLISQFGNWFYIAATYFLVYKYTGKATALGLTLITIFGPKIFSFPIAGIFSDRMCLKRIMIISDILRGIVVLLLFYVKSPDTVYFIYIVNVCLSILATAFKTARTKSIKLIYKDPSSLTKALVLMNSVTDTVLIIGSALGAIAYKLFGFGFVITYDSISFFISALAVYFTHIPENIKEDVFTNKMFVSFKHSIQDIILGFKLATSKDFFLAVFLDSVLIAAFTPINILITVMSTDYYKTGEIGVGILLSFLGLGSIVGSVLVGTKKSITNGIEKNVLTFSPVILLSLSLLYLNIHSFSCGILGVLFLAMGFQYISITFSRSFLSRCKDSNCGRFMGSLNTIGYVAQVISLLVFSEMIEVAKIKPVLLTMFMLVCFVMITLFFMSFQKKGESL